MTIVCFHTELRKIGPYLLVYRDPENTLQRGRMICSEPRALGHFSLEEMLGRNDLGSETEETTVCSFIDTSAFSINLNIFRDWYFILY
jgi:hypothetical protein